MNCEEINLIVEQQLAQWPLAKVNFDKLRDVERRSIRLGELDSAVQFNPARIVSTGASVDPKSIAKRPCFLCKSNRPDEQLSFSWLEGWDLLINPFPILPIHFTIAAQQHIPQDRVPVEMAAMAEMAPDLVFFFNGAKAGASAPDHMHVQAVLKSELPLMRLVSERHLIDMGNLLSSADIDTSFPFLFYSALITPDDEGMQILKKMVGICGVDEVGKPDLGKVNAYFWMDDTGLLRVVMIPRRAHRPGCYYAEGEKKMMVSPGAIDMAGIMILPRKDDFDRIDVEMMRSIYNEVAYPNV